MAIKKKAKTKAKGKAAASSPSPHAEIVVGLPNLQDQIAMINRASSGSSDAEAHQWYDLRELLSDLYTQLQHQDVVRVRRFGVRGRSKPHLL